MGRSFRAPKKSNRDQWKKVELLWKNGFRFFSYRRYPDAEPLPSKLSEVAEFIRRNPEHPFRVES
jgi:hypothetical protein